MRPAAQDVSFEEYLSIKYCSLAESGFQGISINELYSLKDFETSKLLSEHNKYFMSHGLGVLAEQIRRDYRVSNNSRIFIRNNIKDSIKLFFNESLLEIDIPNRIKTVDEIYELLRESDCRDKYIIDKFGLDYSKINPELIIFSSPDELFGIKGLGISWFICSNLKATDIEEKITKLGYSNSYHSEILSIVALRNKHYINKLNSEVVKSNLKLLKNFEHTTKNIFSIEYHHLYNFAKVKLADNLEIETEKFTTTLRKKEGILIRRSDDNRLIINFGQKIFQKHLSILQNFALSYTR